MIEILFVLGTFCILICLVVLAYVVRNMRELLEATANAVITLQRAVIGIQEERVQGIKDFIKNRIQSVIDSIEEEKKGRRKK